MNTTQIIVTLVGLRTHRLDRLVLLAVEGRVGHGSGRSAGGVQVVDVTVKGGYQPSTVVAKAGRARCA